MIRKRGLTYRQIYVGTALALIALLTIISFGYKSLIDSRNSSQWVNHTFAVISNLQKLQSEVNELGTSQRGYILTAQERHLNNYEVTYPEINKDLITVESLIRDNDIQRSRFDDLKKLISQLHDFYEDNVGYVKNGNTVKAIQNVKEGKGEITLVAIRNKIQEMVSHEEDLLNQRLQHLKSSTGQSNVLILVASVLAFLLVLTAAIMIIREFNRRTKIQNDLNKTTEIQKAILNSAAFALIASDSTGAITLFNPAAEKLLGYTAQEIMGKLPSLFHEPSEVEEAAQKLSERFGTNVAPGYETFVYKAKKGIVEADHWTFIRKDGRKVPVSLSVTTQKDTDGNITGYLGIAYDITQQIEYERTIIQAKEQALAGTQAKSEFLANMSHEIRTPMNAIMGMAELLNETDLNEEQKKYVEVFTRAGESLLNIINDILDLSKIEAGHFELDKTQFSLSTVVEKASEMMALKAHQKQLELAIDIDNNLHDFYIGDGNRIRQIIINLLGNAIKFTKKGEVVLKIQNGKTQNGINEVILEVSDTGIGMSEDHLKSLFERFSQADSSITKEYGGTGLGLNITKRLVELMDGEIHVQSEYGKGSKFTVHIYLQRDDIQKHEMINVSLKDKKILIVDDTKTNRFILKKILDFEGAITDEAVDGERALEKINEARSNHRPYDLVLLDCRMPGIDGFSVAENVKNTDDNGPLIMMLTSDNRPGDLAKSKALGLKSYLVKPVLKNELLTEISKALLNTSVVKPAVTITSDKKVDASHVRLLLVDDNDENRLVIKSFLKKLPWIIEEARNGQEALNIFSPAKYDVVLMDMQMPVMDGYTATREIRKLEAEKNASPTPVLALTAYALKEEIDKSINAGCNGHLSKPISKTALIAAVENYTKVKMIIVDKDLEDLIPDYLTNRNNEILELKRAFESKDFATIQALGHKLKGSAGSYGFNELSDIGQVLEDQSKTGDNESISKALEQYELYMKNLKIVFR